MSKQIRKLTFTEMRNLVSSGGDNINNEMFFFTPSFSMGMNVSGVFDSIVRINEPLVLEDSRIGIISAGEADVTVNLVDYHIKAGTVAWLSKGSVVSINKVWPGTTITAMMLYGDTLEMALHGHMPESLNGSRMHFYKMVSEAEAAVITDIMRAAWAVVHQQGWRIETIYGLVSALLYYYDGLPTPVISNTSSGRHSRERALFNRFLRLVNKHGATERQLAFYADRMCLTERYLSTAVKAASGNTAKEWIDRATLTWAKVQLRHTDKPVARIADEAGFASASFFCKYFKRLAGISPGEWRSRG